MSTSERAREDGAAGDVHMIERALCHAAFVWVLATGALMAVGAPVQAQNAWVYSVENRGGARVFQLRRPLEAGRAVALTCDRQGVRLDAVLGRGSGVPRGNAQGRFAVGGTEATLGGRVVAETAVPWATQRAGAAADVFTATITAQAERLYAASDLRVRIGSVTLNTSLGDTDREVLQAGCENARERRTAVASFPARFIVYQGFDGARQQFGIFEKQRDGRWLERQANRDTRNFFDSVRENDREVVLNDPNRDLNIRLDLRGFRVHARFGPGTNWGDLYTLRAVSN